MTRALLARSRATLAEVSRRLAAASEGLTGETIASTANPGTPDDSD